MECTQRLECTQELYETHTQRICPEQIGFLGICGEKHPVLRGPNKIGRDPQACSIVLNLNSVSRQHAVINVLNSKEYMLMDLDSANKTKVLNKTLQPYIPHPLRNGDTVQFGDIFGIFRLLEEDDELPMTQALDIPATQPLDIPETPIPSKTVSKIHKVQTTVIPESPDVSGDDSFLTASHPNVERKRLSSGQFIKPFGKTLSIQPVSSPKTPNNLNLSRRSTPLSFIDNPNTSLNESFVSRCSDKNVTDNIHDMDTQPPNPNESNDSIYTADTQVPPARPISPSIYSLNTQIPSADNLPQIRKIDNQQDMQFDLYAANKENDTSIFNAETQPFAFDKNELMEEKNSFEKQNVIKDKVVSDDLPKSKVSVNTSEEELSFDDIDGDCFEEDLNSQNILDGVPLVEVVDRIETNSINNKSPSKRTNRIKSDSSTDCEDIDMVPTQKVAELTVKNDLKQNIDKVDLTNKVKSTKRVNGTQSDSSTDCEDIDMIPTQKIPEKKVNADDDVTDCEDDELPTNKLIEIGDDITFEDMPTQIIDIDYNKTDQPPNNNVDIEDQPTQIVEEIVSQTLEQAKTTLSNINSSFKIPVQSPKRVKNKDVQKASPANQINISKPSTSTSDEDNYYQATQEIIDDLSSQRETSPDILQPNQDDEEKLTTIDLVSSPAKKHKDISNKQQKSLSNQRASDIKGASIQVATLKKIPSDSSDVELTPKKLRPFIFTDSDLPSSQEIKTSMMTKDESSVLVLSSESEQENTEEQFTPIVHHKKKTKSVPKLDLSKKFEIEMLPERILTRQRKPTDKLGSSTDKNISSRILKSTYLLDQEDQIDQEIISENIKRLKTFEKAKSMRDSKNDVSVKEDVKETSSRSKESKSKEPKEKIRVKIEKPKKKETKPKSESAVRKNDEIQTKQDDSSITTEAKTSRRIRGKKKENEPKENTSKNKSVSPENNKKEAEKRTRNKRKEKSKSPEIEVRRSKRNQTTKEKSLDGAMKAPKPILKNVRESTDYNMSSSSGEPNRSLKRSLVEDSVVPSPKRTRSYINNTNSGISNASLRATPARLNKTHYVLFTAFPSDEVKQKLEKLGAVIVTDVLQCSVVLTMQVKRTFKLLCALGLGRPIVGPSWVQACVDTNIIVDPWLYLVKDESAEKRFQFNLERSLTGKRNFLKGYNVSSTLSVQPNATEMKLIVECSGGSWKEGGPNWVCVSCTKDKGLWPSLRRRGAIVVSTEFILGGVLKQKLDVASYTFP